MGATTAFLLVWMLGGATLGGCQSDRQEPGATTSTPRVVGGLPGLEPDVAAIDPDGAAVLESQGCLGCHAVGAAGNPEIGPELTTLGARLDAKEIELVLLDPDGIMPSYADLPRSDFADLVRFLSLLGAPSPGDTPA